MGEAIRNFRLKRIRRRGKYYIAIFRNGKFFRFFKYTHKLFKEWKHRIEKGLIEDYYVISIYTRPKQGYEFIKSVTGCLTDIRKFSTWIELFDKFSYIFGIEKRAGILENEVTYVEFYKDTKEGLKLYVYIDKGKLNSKNLIDLSLNYIGIDFDYGEWSYFKVMQCLENKLKQLGIKAKYIIKKSSGRGNWHIKIFKKLPKFKHFLIRQKFGDDKFRIELDKKRAKEGIHFNILWDLKKIILGKRLNKKLHEVFRKTYELEEKTLKAKKNTTFKKCHVFAKFCIDKIKDVKAKAIMVYGKNKNSSHIIVELETIQTKYGKFYIYVDGAVEQYNSNINIILLIRHEEQKLIRVGNVIYDFSNEIDVTKNIKDMKI